MLKFGKMMFLKFLFKIKNLIFLKKQKNQKFRKKRLNLSSNELAKRL